jgi:phosphoglycerate dehydrogenase-like enzyme
MAERNALVVAYDIDSAGRKIVEETLQGAGRTIYLKDQASDAREEALSEAGALLTINPLRELEPHERTLLQGARLIQFRFVGVDHIPLNELPAGVPAAGNRGAFAEPMAEHAVAMAFAAAKRLAIEQDKLRSGTFNQFEPTKTLDGAVCGILGFGGTGAAIARKMRALGMKIHAINRRGATSEPVDWIAGPGKLNELLAVADVLVIISPLTRATIGMIGAPQLARMKEDAIVVNLARGEIIDEGALYAHLQSHKRFTACIDAWWIEPLRHGKFAMNHPFLELPNVIASPHNSAVTVEASDIALQRAVANCRRALLGETPLHLLGPDDVFA